jgi:hypothetical protein
MLTERNPVGGLMRADALYMRNAIIRPMRRAATLAVRLVGADSGTRTPEVVWVSAARSSVP